MAVNAFVFTCQQQIGELRRLMQAVIQERTWVHMVDLQCAASALNVGSDAYQGGQDQIYEFDLACPFNIIEGKVHFIFFQNQSL